MRRLVQVGYFLVQPVHSQRILNQVVRADAEKLHAFSERIRRQNRRRNLDHGPGFQGFPEGNPFGAQLPAAFFNQRVGLVQLVQAGNHRIHHLDVALDCRPQDGAELSAKEGAFLQAKANGAPAEERVQFLWHPKVRDEFVAAQIERADDNRIRLQRRGHLTVCLILLVGVE